MRMAERDITGVRVILGFFDVFSTSTIEEGEMKR